MKKVILFLLLSSILSCKKEPMNENLDPQDYINRAKQYYQTNTVTAVRINTQSTLNNSGQIGNVNSRQRLIPFWETAKLEQLPDGQKVVTVSSAKFDLQSTKMGFNRKFIFTERNGEIVDGKIIELFGDAEIIKHNGESLIRNFKQKQIPEFTGTIISYDLNYRYLEGKTYKDGTQLSGLTFISSLAPVEKSSVQNVHKAQSTTFIIPPAIRQPIPFNGNQMLPPKTISAVTPVLEGDGQNCETYFLVYIVRDASGSIVYWENLGVTYQVCNGGYVPDQPGGGGGGGGMPPSDVIIELGDLPDLDVSELGDFPEFKRIVMDLPNFLSRYPNIVKALSLTTGIPESKILDLMQPGKGPKVVVVDNLKDLQGNHVLGNFDPISKVLKIDGAYVRGLDIVNDPTRYQAIGLILTVGTLHEFVHFGRDANGLAPKIPGQNGGSREAGWYFEDSIEYGGAGRLGPDSALEWLKYYRIIPKQ